MNLSSKKTRVTLDEKMQYAPDESAAIEHVIGFRVGYSAATY
ncbi:hypothetical protein [Shewanella aestuarii]|nr:hypothetical protein [Shewanella aestuarii]